MFAWEQRKLGEIFEIQSGFTGDAQLNTGKFKVSRIETISNGVIDSKKIGFSNVIPDKKYKLNVGDILYSNINSIDHIGKIAEYIEDIGLYHGINLLRLASISDNPDFLFYELNTEEKRNWAKSHANKAVNQASINQTELKKQKLSIPVIEEQTKISNFLQHFDSLITLHQRKPFIKNGGIKMITSNFTCDSLFKDYFEFWIKLYKEGAVRPVTLEKYRNNQKHITKIIPNLKMKNFDRNAYQELLNQYALTHERQTVIDFHHQVKGAILDAVDDGLIDRDPTRKAIFKGKAPREKKQKYLNQFELHNLLEDLDLGIEITWDWLILLIAKTGLRFSEALGLTPADFDFARQTISVNKTWDYKTNTGFQPTKNRSSIRKVQMDWQLGMQFQHLIKNLNEDEPIFVNGPVCNSTPNNCLARHCRKCGIPEISIHGLRHTHASLLMFAGVSIASVSRRLGHSSITTTQKVYMHIISELENQDNDLVMRYLSSLS